jgi:predicted anti-sigma-YlaC factor YlaD
MSQHECPFEAAVLEAVCLSRWPGRVDEELRAHAAGCPVCRDVAAVASAFDGALEQARSAAVIPGADRLWQAAQLRARHEAILAAGRPITAAQVIAFASAMALLGACFGATSSWFQAGLGRLAAAVQSPGTAAAVAAAARPLVEYGPFLLGGAALVVLLPAAVYFALGRD